MSGEREFFTVGPRSGKASVASMSGAAAAFQYGLWNAIQQIAEVKGTSDLSWLDQLHKASVAEVKSTIVEGIPIEVEAESLQFGVDVLDTVFKAYRARLINAGNESGFCWGLDKHRGPGSHCPVVHHGHCVLH
jgi:hypothetical protein